jgi:Fur family iron response transcriptional regulator
MTIVNEQTVKVSKATVYNTLNLFVERNLIREVIVDPKKVFYDPNTAPHHHFYDIVSGRLTDIEESAISLVRLPPAPDGMVPDGVDVIVRIRPAGDEK